MAARPPGAGTGSPIRARLLRGQPCDRQNSTGHREYRRPSVGVLQRAGTGRAPAVRILRLGLYAARIALRSAIRGRSRDLPWEGGAVLHRADCSGDSRAAGANHTGERVKVARLLIPLLVVALLEAARPGLAVAQGPRILVMPLENTTRDSKI